MIRKAVVGLAIMIAATAVASAETVLIRAGQAEGQGWAFAGVHGCWVATAGHLVPNDRAKVIVAGTGGVESEGDQVIRDPEHDLAFVHLIGSFASACPPGPIGDRDVWPLVERAWYQRAPIIFQRVYARPGHPGRSYEIEALPVTIVVGAEHGPTFRVRTEQIRGDDLHATDSGGPIRFSGSGTDLAGLPIGIVVGLDVDNNRMLAIVLRMDVVRESFETKIAGLSRVPRYVGSFNIVEFHGETADTNCGPGNLVMSAAGCGWRATTSSPRDRPIEIVLGLDQQRDVDGVVLRFAPKAVPDSVSVWNSVRMRPSPDWQNERNCKPRSGANEVTCTLGHRPAEGLRIRLYGKKINLLEVRILQADVYGGSNPGRRKVGRWQRTPSPPATN